MCSTHHSAKGCGISDGAGSGSMIISTTLSAHSDGAKLTSLMSDPQLTSRLLPDGCQLSSCSPCKWSSTVKHLPVLASCTLARSHTSAPQSDSVNWCMLLMQKKRLSGDQHPNQESWGALLLQTSAPVGMSQIWKVGEVSRLGRENEGVAMHA